MSTVEEKLKELEEYLKVIEHYNQSSALVYWDMTTGMPEKALDDRAETMSFLGLQAHNLSVASKMDELIKFFESYVEELDDVHKRMTSELRKAYDKNKVYPEEFIKEISLACSKGEAAWAKAKNENDFEVFRPHLQKIVDLTKKSITFKPAKKNIYDSLLDDYEPGLTVEKLDKVFGDLRNGIVEILNKIKATGVEVDNSFFKKTFSKESQQKFSIEVLNKMGFDFKAGRLDESEHPYTTNMGNKDVRITSHYYENEFTFALYSAIHEGGHAIYEQDIPDSLRGTGLNQASSMAVHESQSRFYENIVGRSKAFCKYLYKSAKEQFPQFADVDEEGFYKAINKVEPSLIRTEADELTYSLHVIIRYEIEKLLINDKITVDELPKIWNEKYKEYLGIEPPTDTEGVLQDVHWAGGSFGYFPSYALGNLYGAQMLNKMLKDVPNIYDEIAEGNLDSVHKWLSTNVHECASLYDPSDLIKRITGEELNAKYFLEYLDKKFKDIYNY